MERHPDIDDITAERLLRGWVGPDDAPDTLRGVAVLLAAAGHADAAPADAAIVAAMVDAITASPVARHDGSGRRTATRLLSAKAAAVFGVVALSASGAAAATGRLPAVAQDRLAQAVSHVGIHLPTSGDDETDDEAGDEAGTDGEHGNSADTHGAEVSDTARTTDATGREKGEAVSTVARDGHGEAAPGQTAADDHPTGPPEGRVPEKPASAASTTTPTTAAPQAPAGSTPAGSRPTTDDRPRGRP